MREHDETYTYRLQPKPGLLWYRHHPKIHEMVSDGSSRAENWTDPRHISMRIFVDSKMQEQQYMIKIRTLNNKSQNIPCNLRCSKMFDIN